MPRTSIAIPTEDGSCTATLHTPSTSGSHPAVIIYPDAVGVRETFAAMADRLAGLGYAVLLPDVYYRTPYAPFDGATLFSEPAERARLGELSGSLSTERIVKDANAFLSFLADRAEVSGTNVGTTGYCMGGAISLIVAGHRPDRVAAAASFHGGNLAAANDEDSPHLLADRISAELYVAAAENDKYCPTEQIERLENVLTAAGVRHTIETYPAEHGFAVSDNPTYDASAAERHWTAMAELFAGNLPN